MDLKAEINRLKREKNAVVLAHNYQLPEVQDAADLLGDSLDLSIAAAKTNARMIVFAGVYFMAETAAILNPNRKVLIPDPSAGCSLVDSVDNDYIVQWRRRHPDGVVIVYINTSAYTKALADYVCTSANCLKIIESMPSDKPILFLPDKNLGLYIREKTGREMEIWDGECYVHAAIKEGDVLSLMAAYPDAEVMAHPECACGVPLLRRAPTVRFLSTQGMVKYVKESPRRRFIIATEKGILYRMAKEAPGKELIPAWEGAVCKYMKRINLEKVYRSLRDEVYEVRVDPEVARRARSAIERMFQFA